MLLAGRFNLIFSVNRVLTTRLREISTTYRPFSQLHFRDQGMFAPLNRSLSVDTYEPTVGADMGQTHHREQVRQKIIQSALQLFNRHGFTAASIDHIMAGA